MFRTNRFTTSIFTVFALAGVALVTGCSDLAQPPLAPEDGAAISSDSQPPARAAKKAKNNDEAPADGNGLYTETASGNFSPGRNGKLKVSFPGYGDGNTVRVRSVQFKVKKGQIDQERHITMTVESGTALEDLEKVSKLSRVLGSYPRAVLAPS